MATSGIIPSILASDIFLQSLGPIYARFLYSFLLGFSVGLGSSCALTICMLRNFIPTLLMRNLGPARIGHQAIAHARVVKE